MEHLRRHSAEFTLPVSPLASASPMAVRPQTRMPDRVEWPTVWIACAVYLPVAASLAAVALADVPWWSVVPVLAWCAAWQASLQHEVIHGHPTPWPWVNRLIAGPPLLLFMPFDRYRDSHLAHHIDERLTDPLDDPESWYVTAERWRRASRPERALRKVMNTFAGRIVFGPLWIIGQSAVTDGRDLLAGRRIFALSSHALQLSVCAVTLVWAGVPMSGYLLLVVWPATGLMLVRSFAEHRPSPVSAHRSVIVEHGGVLGVLYLSNNLHALHHERPGLSWYLLRRVFRDGRQGIFARNGAYRYKSYGKMAMKYLFSPRDHPIHPLYR